MAKPSSDTKITSDYGVITANDKADITKLGKSFMEAVSKHREWKRELDGLV